MKILKLVVKFIIGLLKGGIVESGPLSVFKDLKNFNKKEAIKMLDVNGDGNVNIQDVQALQWETVGKFLGVVAAWIALAYVAGKLGL